MSEETVNKLVHDHTDGPTLVAFGGEPIVNVLELNLALDDAARPPVSTSR
jgi:K+-transporting ATPase c subunit